jgi:hypothetical protein
LQSPEPWAQPKGDIGILQAGEPYILFIDHVNRAPPEHQRELELRVNTSNLCSEITLPTGKDHDGKKRTAAPALRVSWRKGLKSEFRWPRPITRHA